MSAANDALGAAIGAGVAKAFKARGIPAEWCVMDLGARVVIFTNSEPRSILAEVRVRMDLAPDAPH